jgi:hypothetical protein
VSRWSHDPRKDNSANLPNSPCKKIRRTRISPPSPQKETESRSRPSAAGNAVPAVPDRRKPPIPAPKSAPAPPPQPADATAAHKDRARATSPAAPIHPQCAPTALPASQPARGPLSPGPGTTNCPSPTATTLCQELNARSMEPRQWRPSRAASYAV